MTKALHGQDLHAVAMENDAAKLIDVIESSLEMVRKSEANIGIITDNMGRRRRIRATRRCFRFTERLFADTADYVFVGQGVPPLQGRDNQRGGQHTGQDDKRGLPQSARSSAPSLFIAEIS